MTWAAVGSIVLGIVIMYLAMIFVTRQKSHTVVKLTAFIGVLLGGTVVQLLVDRIGADSKNFGPYAVGLYGIAYAHKHGYLERTRNQLGGTQVPGFAPGADPDLVARRAVVGACD